MAQRTGGPARWRGPWMWISLRRCLGVVRPAEPGDDRRFFYSQLTPDGRHYLWVGPRFPPLEL